MATDEVVRREMRRKAGLEAMRRIAGDPPPWTWTRFLQSMWRWTRGIFASAIHRLIIRPLWRLIFKRFFFLKQSPADVSAEIAAMQFVRQHTSIPVPRPWGSFRCGGYVYLVMQRVSGAPLSDSMWNNFTEDEKCRVVEQLRGFVHQLRNIPPRSGSVVGSVNGAQGCDYRLCGVPHGPYLNEQQMNHQLRMGIPLREVPPKVIESHSRQHPFVFTHGDIAGRNIMMDGARVVALIDWEGAGWFPAHWEYCKARYASGYLHNEDWMARISKFIPPYVFEDEADTELRVWQQAPDLPPMKLDGPYSPNETVEVYFDQAFDPTRPRLEDTSPLISILWPW